MPLGTVISLTPGKAFSMLIGQDESGLPAWVFAYIEEGNPDVVIASFPIGQSPDRMGGKVWRELHNLVSSDWLDNPNGEWSRRIEPIIVATAASVPFPPEGTVKCPEGKCWLEESRGRYMLHQTREGASLGAETCPTCKGRGYIKE